jgi:hypothetical protein
VGGIGIMVEETLLVMLGVAKSFAENIDDIFDRLISEIVKVDSILDPETA